jgi:ACR3 family arsenite efflux pump ArsB
MRKFLWAWVAFSSVAGVICGVMVWGMEGAPQQAEMAAIACAFAIISYFLASGERRVQ